MQTTENADRRIVIERDTMLGNYKDSMITNVISFNTDLFPSCADPSLLIVEEDAYTPREGLRALWEEFHDDEYHFSDEVLLDDLDKDWIVRPIEALGFPEANELQINELRILPNVIDAYNKASAFLIIDRKENADKSDDELLKIAREDLADYARAIKIGFWEVWLHKGDEEVENSPLFYKGSLEDVLSEIREDVPEEFKSLIDAHDYEVVE